MNKVKIEFDAIPQNEAFARMAISGFILYLDPTINDMADIKTAVSEAVTNSIIHGYDNKGGKIFLNAEVEEKKLRKAEFEAGREAGHEAGFAEGENHAALEIASRMLQSDKFSLDEIANFSGLSIAEVKKLCTDKQ